MEQLWGLSSEDINFASVTMVAWALLECGSAMQMPISFDQRSDQQITFQIGAVNSIADAWVVNFGGVRLKGYFDGPRIIIERNNLFAR